MALTDSGASAQTVSGFGAPLRVTAGGAWKKGDILGYSGTSIVQADVDAPVVARFVAGTDAASGEVKRTVYLAAYVRGGRYSGGTVGATVFSHTTAGLISETVSAVPVGRMVSADEALIYPSLGPALVL